MQAVIPSGSALRNLRERNYLLLAHGGSMEVHESTCTLARELHHGVFGPSLKGGYLAATIPGDVRAHDCGEAECG